LISNSAEYPLQWLGEHLINQSFLYENNPDTTGIKERFFYNFDPEPLSGGGANSSVPTAATAAAAAATTTTTTTTGAVAAATSDNISTADIANTSTADTQLPDAEARDMMPQQPLYNGEQHAVDGQMVGTEEGYDVSEQMDLGHEHNSRDHVNTGMLNGVAEAERDEVAAEHGEGVGEGVMDTEMAGST
jgi:Tfp pilus assembly major pilin PilA